MLVEKIYQMKKENLFLCLKKNQMLKLTKTSWDTYKVGYSEVSLEILKAWLTVLHKFRKDYFDWILFAYNQKYEDETLHCTLYAKGGHRYR